MAAKEKPGKENGGEKTCIKSLGLLGEMGLGGSPTAVDVENGKVVRIRPLHYDWKYKPEEVGTSVASETGG